MPAGTFVRRWLPLYLIAHGPISKSTPTFVERVIWHDEFSGGRSVARSASSKSSGPSAVRRRSITNQPAARKRSVDVKSRAAGMRSGGHASCQLAGMASRGMVCWSPLSIAAASPVDCPSSVRSRSAGRGAADWLRRRCETEKHSPSLAAKRPQRIPLALNGRTVVRSKSPPIARKAGHARSAAGLGLVCAGGAAAADAARRSEFGMPDARLEFMTRRPVGVDNRQRHWRSFHAAAKRMSSITARGVEHRRSSKRRVRSAPTVIMTRGGRTRRVLIGTRCLYRSSTPRCRKRRSAYKARHRAFSARDWSAVYSPSFFWISTRCPVPVRVERCRAIYRPVARGSVRKSGRLDAPAPMSSIRSQRVPSLTDPAGRSYAESPPGPRSAQPGRARPFAPPERWQSIVGVGSHCG